MPYNLPDGVSYLEKLTASIRKTFELYGYQKVSTPILENPEPFLDRSGEQVRSSMYIFSDSGGNEVCLRPEMTIPVIHLFNKNRDYFKSPVSRLFYSADVMRYYGDENKDKLRQFTQIGLENIGNNNISAADSEILGIALKVFNDFQASVSLKIGSSILLLNFFNKLPLQENIRFRLIRSFHDKAKFRHFLNKLRKDSTIGNSGDEGLNELNDSDYFKFRFKGKFFGDREPADILKRLEHKSNASGVSAELLDAIEQFTSIDDEPSLAVKKMTEIQSLIGVSPDSEMDRLLELIDGLNLGNNCRISCAFSRNLEYYSGLVFEFADNRSDSNVGTLCSGGRYDKLMHKITGNDFPAVGFGINLQKLADLLKSEKDDAILPPSKSVLYIYSASADSVVKAMELCDIYREKNISVVYEGVGNFKEVKSVDVFPGSVSAVVDSSKTGEIHIKGKTKSIVLNESDFSGLQKFLEEEA